MRNIFRRKPIASAADEAYDSLPDALVTQTPILAQLVAEWRSVGDLPAGVA